MINSANLKEIISIIIQHQQSIIGPIALEQARKIPEITINASNDIQFVNKNTDAIQILDHLVRQYEKLFGQTSIEVCKDAIRETQLTISPTDLPEILR